MHRHTVHLRAFAVEGWQALARARSVWALAAGALVFSGLSLVAELPLREPGRFNLTTLALIDQLLVLLLVLQQQASNIIILVIMWFMFGTELNGFKLAFTG